jgi:exonuclease SbcD
MALKILHLADLHLGAAAYERWRGGRPERLDEFLAALDAALAAGEEAGVHAVVVAGDVYDQYRPEPLVQQEWARRVARLRARGTPLVVCLGNHDRAPRAAAVSAQAVFAALNLPGVYVAAEPTLWEIPTAAGALTVAAAPWDAGGAPETAAATAARLEDLVRNRWRRALARARPAIFVGHVWVAGGRLSSESAGFLGQAQIPPRAIADRAFAYYALGHLHLHQKIAFGAGGPAVYAGSIAPLDFSDEGAPKGAVLVELEPGEPTRWRFIQLPARPFLTVDVAATTPEEAAAQVAAFAAAHRTRGAVVRCRVTGPAGLGPALDRDALADAFPESLAFRLEVVVPTAARRRAGIAPELDLAAALRLYAADHPPASDLTWDDILARADALAREESAAG